MQLRGPLVGVVAGGSLAVALLTGTGRPSPQPPPVVVPRMAAIVGETMPTGDVLDSDPTGDELDDPMDGMVGTMSGQDGTGGGQDAMTPGGQNGTRRIRHDPLASP